MLRNYRMLAFKKGSRKANMTIYHVVPEKVVEAAGKHLGEEYETKAKSAFDFMEKTDTDLMQTHIGDTRVRFQIAA